jgi:hypothetical protein
MQQQKNVIMELYGITKEQFDYWQLKGLSFHRMIMIIVTNENAADSPTMLIK